MAEESRGAARLCGPGKHWMRSMKEPGSNRSEVWPWRKSGEPTGPLALNVLLESDAKIISCADGGRSAAKMNPVRRASGMPSEGKSADQLNLARGAGGGQDLAYVIGEITLRILEDGIPVTS